MFGKIQLTRQNIDLICFGGIFCLSIFLGWLLALAYPEGITTGETPTYYWAPYDYHWFAANGADWMRTPVFGRILNFAAQLPNPTNAVYWLNTFLFSLSSALIYVLGKRLFDSTSAGITLTLAALFFEFASMRMFFTNLQIIADSFFGELVHLAVLLALIGWLYRRYLFILTAYAILSLATFTKPIGISLLPIWICFIAVLWLRAEKRNYKDKNLLLFSALLLVAPVTLWTARNYCIYGYPKYMSSTGVSLLMATLPIMSDNDKLFEDKKVNAEFITSVRECERNGFYKESFTNLPPFVARLFRFEDYFCYPRSARGPFDYLAQLKRADKEEREALMYDSARMFKLDEIAKTLALKLICAHPLDYLKRVFTEYTCLYIPSDALPAPWDCLNADPKITHLIDPALGMNVHRYLYRHGIPDISLGNQSVARVLDSFCNNATVKWLLSIYYDNQLWLCHLIFLVALAICLFPKIQKSNTAQILTLKRKAITIILLFLTAAIQYLVIGLLTTARLRYSLGSGELELHLLFLIALIEIIRQAVAATRGFVHRYK